MSNIPTNAVVWFEMPVSNLARAKAFYGSATGFELKDEQMGPNMTSLFAHEDGKGVGGHLYEGKPAAKGTGGTPSLAIADRLEQALERVTKASGEVVSPIIEIPAGRFAYCLDPDGNSFSLFEYAK